MNEAGQWDRFAKDPAEALDYTTEFESHCARYRNPGAAYSTATRVRPRKATGLQYNASTGGVTGTDEPRWPKTAGGTVVDGSVTWTAEAMSNTSLIRTLSSAVWTLDTGITKASQVESGTSSVAVIAGGTLGQIYQVRCDGTFSDATVKSAVFFLPIVRPRTITP